MAAEPFILCTAKMTLRLLLDLSFRSAVSDGHAASCEVSVSLWLTWHTEALYLSKRKQDQSHIDEDDIELACAQAVVLGWELLTFSL